MRSVRFPPPCKLQRERDFTFAVKSEEAFLSLMLSEMQQISESQLLEKPNILYSVFYYIM